MFKKKMVAKIVTIFFVVIQIYAYVTINLHIVW